MQNERIATTAPRTAKRTLVRPRHASTTCTSLTRNVFAKANLMIDDSGLEIGI